MVKFKSKKKKEKNGENAKKPLFTIASDLLKQKEKPKIVEKRETPPRIEKIEKTAPKSKEEKIKYCQVCGKEINDKEQLICEYCGKEL